MDILDCYILFCLTTAITAAIELLHPVILKQTENAGTVDSKLTIYTVFIVISTMFAPFIFFSCIIPSWGERFKTSLHKGLFPEE
jgi:hypothetical protein